MMTHEQYSHPQYTTGSHIQCHRALAGPTLAQEIVISAVLQAHLLSHLQKFVPP